MHFSTLVRSSCLFLMFNFIMSCSFNNERALVKKKEPLSEVRYNFKSQVEALSADLEHSSLVTSSKNTKKIVESFLNRDDLQDKLDVPFKLSFEKVNDYYKRSQFWLEQFDKQLSLIKPVTDANKATDTNKVVDTNPAIDTNPTGNANSATDSNRVTEESADSSEEVSFLENSSTYKILQSLRLQQEENINKIVNEYEFLLQTYNGLANEDTNLDLEEKLKRSVVAAKFLLKLSSLEEVWLAQDPLVFEKVHEHLVELNAEVDSEFNKYRKIEEGKKFTRAKDRVLANISEIDYESALPTQEMSRREIDLFQKNSALKGEKITELTNKDEILSVENSAANFFGSSLNLQLKPMEAISASKCIKPSLGSEGNLSGTELPKNNWVLTLDDGPSTKYTEEFLRYLRDDGIKASFFMLAKKMTPYKAMVNKVNSDGHTIASHSWSHANLPKLAAAALDHEIIDPNSVHQGLLNRKPNFFRCPYGAGFKEAAIRQRIVSQGMVHVFWNVDTLDWQDKNPESIVKRTLEQMASQKRGIILFHDIHPQSLAASRELVNQLKNNKDINWLSIQAAMALINKNRGCGANDGIQ